MDAEVGVEGEQSGRNRPLVPAETGHGAWSNPATPAG